MMWPSTAVGQGLENVGALQPHVQLHVEEEPLFTDVPTCWILREDRWAGIGFKQDMVRLNTHIFCIMLHFVKLGVFLNNSPIGA